MHSYPTRRNGFTSGNLRAPRLLPSKARVDHHMAVSSLLINTLILSPLLCNLPTIFLVLIHLLFVIFAVSPYSSTTERYLSWKTILPAEAFIVLFFALVSPSMRAYITELAEPVIASTLVGNDGQGTAVCAFVMFAAGRIPEVLFGGFIRLKK